MFKSYLTRKLLAVALPTLLAIATQTYAQDVIRIGMTVSSTGNFALASQSGVRGVEIWVDDVNRRGGIDIGGQKKLVELVKLDDRSDKQMVTRVYERLITDEKVDLVFGPFGSTLTTAAATVTERLNTYMMIWSASVDSLYDQGFKYIVSGSQIPVSTMLRYPMELAKNLGIEKVAMLYSDEPFTAGLAESARAYAKENGINIVLDERYPKGQKDFSTLLQKVRASNVNAFVAAAYEGDLISMARQMRQLNISFPYVFMPYAAQPQFLEIGKDADYIFGYTTYHPTVQWEVTSGMNIAQFSQAYERLFPNVKFAADFQTAQAYAAGVLTEEIIQHAGSLDAEALKAASLALSDKVTVLLGPYAINEAGKQIKMSFVVTQVIPGEGLAVVWPKEVANREPLYPIPAWKDR